VRFVSEVTESDCSTADRNVEAAIQVHGGHLPFHDVLQRCQQACFKFLYALTGFDDGLSTPHVEADLLRGVDVGPMEIGVAVERVGNTSFTLRCDVTQHGTRAAVVRMVLVSYDYETGTSRRLSDAKKSGLGNHLMPLDGPLEN